MDTLKRKELESLIWDFIEDANKELDKLLINTGLDKEIRRIEVDMTVYPLVPVNEISIVLDVAGDSAKPYESIRTGNIMGLRKEEEGGLPRDQE